MAAPSLIGRPSLLSSNSQSSRRREPSFPSLTRGSSTQAAASTPIGAWGAAPSAAATAAAGAELSASALRKKGPSLSLALSQGGELKGETIHPLKYNWDVTFQHRSASNNNRGNGKKEEQNKGGKEKETREDWETGRQDLGSFSSVESLHPFLAHLTSPSALPASLNSSATIFTPDAAEVPPTSNLISDLNIFRSPVVPTWEDAANVGGGRWVLRLRKGVADRIWEEVVFALVGERLGGEEGTAEANAGAKINGVVLSVRKDEDILSLWCAPSTRPERDAIRDSLRLALEPLLTATALANLSLDYKPHPSANQPSATLGTPNGGHFHSNGHHPHHHRRNDRDRSVDPDRADRLPREPSQGGTSRRAAGFSAYASPRAPRDASREPGEIGSAFGERRAELGLARTESGGGFSRSRPEMGERGESTRSAGAWGRSYA